MSSATPLNHDFPPMYPQFQERFSPRNLLLPPGLSELQSKPGIFGYYDDLEFFWNISQERTFQNSLSPFSDFWNFDSFEDDISFRKNVPFGSGIRIRNG